MSIGYLNERTQTILNMVLKRSSEFSIKEVAEELSVSTRTIYNELEKANGWLEMKERQPLRVIRGKIQPCPEEERRALERLLEEEEVDKAYVFTPTERTKIIVCQIVVSGNPTAVEDLMETCQVSRNTIFTDLQAVISQLYTYQLELRYEKKTGYWIQGDPIRVRAIFFLYFNMLEPLLSAGHLNFLHMEEIRPYLERIEQVENELKVCYVRNDMLALAAMIPVMERGNSLLTFSDVSTVKVKQSTEYRLLCRYFPELPENEQIYMTLHFLGGRLASYSREEKTQERNEFVWEISKNLVTEFERRACVIFEKKEDLLENLYRHIDAAMYRYRFGIQIGNRMEADIQREYPYIFDIVRVTARYLEQQIGVQISDSEVSYLALHFGAHLEYARHDEKELRILVVCMNGVATGNMISHELKRILPQARIVGVMTVAQIVNPQNICDLIISSVKLKSTVPVILVNPILNDFDRRNILNHPMIRSRFGFVDTDALYQVVKKYVAKEKQAELRNDLERFFRGKSEEHQPVLNPDIWHLTDFLTEDRVLFLDKEDSWEEAIQKVSEPLLKRESMEEFYVKCIIERLKEAGPYMFVTPDLILAHARPENGVRHLDFSIGIAPDGIEFQGGKKARVVFCLVVEDQYKHMGILRDIRKGLAKAEQVDELMQCRTPEEICTLLRTRLSEE